MKVISQFQCHDIVHGKIAKTKTTYRIVEDTDEYSHLCFRIQVYLPNIKKWTDEYQSFIHWSTLQSLFMSEQFRILFGHL